MCSSSSARWRCGIRLPDASRILNPDPVRFCFFADARLASRRHASRFRWMDARWGSSTSREAQADTGEESGPKRTANSTRERCVVFCVLDFLTLSRSFWAHQFVDPGLFSLQS